MQVHGKRFVYKFICDLKTLLGFSAGELYLMVKNCAEKHAIRNRKRRAITAYAENGTDDESSVFPKTECQNSLGSDSLNLDGFSSPPLRHQFGVYSSTHADANYTFSGFEIGSGLDSLYGGSLSPPDYAATQSVSDSKSQRLSPQLESPISESAAVSSSSSCGRKHFANPEAPTVALRSSASVSSTDSGLDPHINLHVCTDGANDTVLDPNHSSSYGETPTSPWRLRRQWWVRNPISSSPPTSPTPYSLQPDHQRVASEDSSNHLSSATRIGGNVKHALSRCASNKSPGRVSASHFALDEDWVAAATLRDELAQDESSNHVRSTSLLTSPVQSVVRVSSISTSPLTHSVTSTTTATSFDDGEIATAAASLLSQAGNGDPPLLSAPGLTPDYSNKLCGGNYCRSIDDDDDEIVGGAVSVAAMAEDDDLDPTRPVLSYAHSSSILRCSSVKSLPSLRPKAKPFRRQPLINTTHQGLDIDAFLAH